MIKIGFIGSGGVANYHRDAFAGIKNAKVIAVYDLNNELAQQMAKKTNAKVCKNEDEVIQESDAVYILTPPHTHKEFTLKAIASGKHILCEKPLSISLNDGRAIVDALKGTNVKFMTAFTMRFRDSYQSLKRIVESGKLGSILTLYFQRMFGGGSYDPKNWRYRPESGCGISIESLSHQIDLIRWLLSDISSVYAKVIASHPELPNIDNNVHIILNLKNGATAILHVSWTSYLGLNSTGIIGTKGTVRICGNDGANHDLMSIKFEGSEEENIELNEPYSSDIFKNESQYFIDCINKNQLPMAGADDGLRALEVSHAILKSSKENRLVEL